MGERGRSVNEEFLEQYREEPRPEFAKRLAGDLRAIAAGSTAPPEPEPASRRPVRPLLLGAAAVLVVASSFALAPVRAAAQTFLDVFRVKRFVAVPFDRARIERLQSEGLDLKSMIAGQVEVLEPAREPELQGSVEAAGAVAGIAVRQPAVLPEGAAFAEVAVGRPGAFRVTFDVAKIEVIAHAAGVEDASIPDSWDGATIGVRASPVVVLKYRRAKEEFTLLEARQPALDLPETIELPELGTLALRVAGMSPEEARLFARKVDWRSTLLVPIPVGGGTFREVEVGSAKGLLVTAVESEATRRGRYHSVLLWAEGDRGFALHGPGQGVEILEMAQSIR
jgi:hypothetical protein